MLYRRGDGEATLRQRRRDLYLVVVDVLILLKAPRDKHRALPSLKGRQRRSDAGVRDENVRLPHRHGELSRWNRLMSIDP